MTLRERVAEAIWRATESEAWSQVNDAARRFVLTEAAAAIEAMHKWLEERGALEEATALKTAECP